MYAVSCQFIHADQSSIDCADQFKTHFKTMRPATFVRSCDYTLYSSLKVKKQGNICWFIPADHDL